MVWTLVPAILGESSSLSSCIELADLCSAVPFRIEQAGRVMSTSCFLTLAGRALTRLGHLGGLIWNSGCSSLSSSFLRENKYLVLYGSQKIQIC